MTIDLPARPRILVVALRRLGDVLLTTPLIRSLRRTWPEAALDALVFAGTEGMLTGNSDLSGVFTLPEHPSTAASLAVAAKLARRYDLAMSTQGGDRPTLFAFVAGRRRAGIVDPGRSGAIKARALTWRVSAAPGVHRVEELLRLADMLGAARCAEVVCPQGPVRSGLVPAAPYAVIHPTPMFRYKRWTAGGWRELADALMQRGLIVVVTGGPQADEREYLDALWRDAPQVRRLDGALAWPEIAALLANAHVYVGPDTSVTHLAAASGCPTVALYGPTDPRKWGPWPAGGLATPWAASGTVQRRGNVWLVQNPLPCLPCQQEGCDGHRLSESQCLDELPARLVIGAIDQALAWRGAESGANA